MDEYSRILIEEYCTSHNSAKSRRLMKLLNKSYNIESEMTDAEAIFLEKAIDSEKDEELREALQELDGFLCGY